MGRDFELGADVNGDGLPDLAVANFAINDHRSEAYLTMDAAEAG
ncbi:MAG: hypothetical protein ACI8PZ_000082, partial [Myxococcota bacterium]